jgi:quinoprotein dehydrogenase-associated probable ABC transporter substrate-binding protein
LAQTRPDLVSTDRLRVCADPADMPFSDKAKEGFENKIAGVIADELKLPLHFYFMPQGPGYVRNTLGTTLCDVIIGYASASDIVDHTNPYYASTYVLVTKKGGPLDGVDRLEDPKLKNAKLGIMAGTPPADHFMELGLTPNAKTYPLLVDRRYASPNEDAMHDIESGLIDGAVLWGPIAGYYAKMQSPPLSVTPLIENKRPKFDFRIGFGIRRGESDWKHRLNDVIRKRKQDIEAILRAYGVPLVPIDSATEEAPPGTPGAAREE